MRNRFFRKYLSTNVLPIWAVLLLDVVIVIFSCLIAFFLKQDMEWEDISDNSFSIEAFLLFSIVVNVFFFRCFRTYLGVLRYSSFVDIMRIFVSLTLSYIVLICINGVYYLAFGGKMLPESTILMAYVLNFALMSSSRVVVKMMYEASHFDSRRSVNVFIYGAKEAGVNIAKSLRVNLKNRYRLRGFIADEPELVDKVMMGVKVYANDDSLLETLDDRGISAVIVSPAKLDQLSKTDLADKLLSHHIKLLTAPPLSEWNNQELDHTQLKEIQIEDLLPRAPIEIDMRKIASHLEGKRVMITGAAGSIGSEIMRQVVSFNPYKLILIDQAETPLHDIRLMMAKQWPDIEAPTIVADICMKERMEEIFSEYRPDYVFHAAAYKHVPMMEDNPGESIRNNIEGTRIIADLAVKYGTKKFVMVSTDKAVNPTNLMGCSKRICEIYVQSLDKAIKDGKIKGDTQFVTTRFGNVLGSNGSVIPLFKEQIKNGGPVTVTHKDIIRYFMLIPEACKLVLEAGTMGNGGEIFVFDMGKPVKIIDLAQRMIQLSGAKDIEIKITGLRDGEKLYEEVLNEQETTKPTFHPKIKIATVREYNYEDACRQIDEMVKASATENDMELVKRMKRMVPEYKSQHSVYEILDK